MMDLQSILAGRLSAISGRVAVGAAVRKQRKPRARPGFKALSAKLARASEQIRGSRHGRRRA